MVLLARPPRVLLRFSFDDGDAGVLVTASVVCGLEVGEPEPTSITRFRLDGRENDALVELSVDVEGDVGLGNGSDRSVPGLIPSEKMTCLVEG